MKVDNFNEKRCDILKACIAKQRRYIASVNKTHKLQKKFYKDIKYILAYLVELNEKHVVLNNKSETENQNQLKRSERIDLTKKIINDIQQNYSNDEVLKDFIKNFNEAYVKVKNIKERNFEIDKLFNLSSKSSKISNIIEKITNPEAVKKIKYNYIFKDFIEKYKDIFPVSNIFNEFELKDKSSFSVF